VPAVWLGMIAIATTTDLIDLVFTPGHTLGSIAAVSVIVRFFGVFWLAAVAIRRLVENPALAWALDGGFVFFYLWQIALLVSEGVAEFLLEIAKNLSDLVVIFPVHPYTVTLIFIAVSTPIADLLSLRIVPWMVARTTRLSAVTFGMAWRGMRGNWRDAAKTYLVLVLPLFVVHYVLTAWLPGARIAQFAKIEWTLLDGVAFTLMLMLLLALYVACFQRAKLVPERATLVDPAI
jgi:hypothetical protein